MYKKGFNPKTLEIRRKQFTGTSYYIFFVVESDNLNLVSATISITPRLVLEHGNNVLEMLAWSFKMNAMYRILSENRPVMKTPDVRLTAGNPEQTVCF